MDTFTCYKLHLTLMRLSQTVSYLHLQVCQLQVQLFFSSYILGFCSPLSVWITSCGFVATVDWIFYFVGPILRTNLLWFFPYPIDFLLNIYYHLSMAYFYQLNWVFFCFLWFLISTRAQDLSLSWESTLPSLLICIESKPFRDWCHSHRWYKNILHYLLGCNTKLIHTLFLLTILARIMKYLVS